MTDPKRTFFRYVEGEESQTDFFVSLLSWADEQQVLNAIHDKDDIEFGESAQVVATQRDGLPDHPPENDSRRTLDWVVRDEGKLVGYESKCGDTLNSKKLREERRKLEYNANDREVHLFAFTEDIYEPNFNAGASWKSWFDVGTAVIDIDEKSTPIEVMTEMFREEGYEGFRGFTEYRRDEGWLITHQNEAVDFLLEATERAKDLKLYENKSGYKRVDHYNRVQNRIEKVKQSDSRAFGPSYYVFAIIPVGYRDAERNYNVSRKGWYIAIVVPALHNRVFVEQNTYLRKDDEAKEIKQDDNAEGLTDIVVSKDMHVHSSWNSLLKEETPTRHTDRDEILEVLSQKGGEQSWRRLRFGWEIDTDQSPEEMVEEAAQKMEQLHDIFYDGVERRTEFSPSSK